MIRYSVPTHWIIYDKSAVFTELVEAKAAVQALISTPFQRSWVEALQALQLKREVAGTSRIEGADFTDNELDAALNLNASPSELISRSQRQAHAATQTYRWIAQLPNDRPLDAGLVKEIHRRLVSGCDDDHCPPGRLRARDQNVTFGVPPHRGCEGGRPVEEAFNRLIHAAQTVFHDHDLLIQALAFHYHFAAMHPFLDGNGRTARALEALMLQRAGLTDNAFIAMSNYYYDEKFSYLQALSAVRADNHNLTSFLKFALPGIAIQCGRLHSQIRKHMERALFRNTMFDLFNRLASPRKRVIHDRQLKILKILLEVDTIDWLALKDRIHPTYASMKAAEKTISRDMRGLLNLGAITVTKRGPFHDIAIDPTWPQRITESQFFQQIRQMPKGKTYSFL